MEEIQSIENISEVPLSACWSYSGNLFCIATKDGILSYYDPRMKSTPAGVPALF